MTSLSYSKQTDSLHGHFLRCRILTLTEWINSNIIMSIVAKLNFGFNHLEIQTMFIFIVLNIYLLVLFMYLCFLTSFLLTPLFAPFTPLDLYILHYYYCCCCCCCRWCHYYDQCNRNASSWLLDPISSLSSCASFERFLSHWTNEKIKLHKLALTKLSNFMILLWYVSTRTYT